MKPAAPIDSPCRFHRGESRGRFHFFHLGQELTAGDADGVLFFLPSILLSGFMFPFRGMPEWAQWLGEILSLTHPLRILRGILLKGNEVSEILPNLWPIRRVSSRRGRCGARALPRYARLNALRAGTLRNQC